MRHYEIVFIKIVEIGGIKTIKWSASCRTFDTKRNAIRYAEQSKGDRHYRVYKVETDINGNPTKGYTGLELVNKLYNEFR